MNLAHRLGALLSCLPALALAQPAVVTTEHVRAELVAHAPQGVAPGRPMWLGLFIRHEPHWHTYWKNPGDSGLATTLGWKLPAGVQASEIRWPTPQQLRVGPLMNYGYEGELLLPVELTLPGTLAGQSFEVRLRADWLVCKEICIPESGEFALRLPVGSAIDGHAGLFAAAQARAPRPAADALARGRTEGQVLVVEVDGLPAVARGQALQFFAETAGVVDHAAPIEQRWDGERWSARVALSSQRSESPSVMPAVLVAKASAGILVRLDIAGPWPGAASAAQTPATTPSLAPGASGSLLLTLGLALLGGLLLNLMPCVFPVLSLKLAGLAQRRNDRRGLVAGGLAYTAGVLTSFLALAGVLLILRAGGEQLGWGFQLQSPAFVAALAVLFTLIGLNLAGVFELSGVLPGNLAAARVRHPLADDALTGALAVAVASPCTGPFMGVALGTALALPAAQALAVFAALALGMALPYLAVSLVPGLAGRLPRPGVWMQRFKALMAFPMFATVVWLVWVLGQQVGIDGAVALLALLLVVAFAAWSIGSPGFGRRARWAFAASATIVLAATLAGAWPAIVGPSAQVAASARGAGDGWQVWSAEAVAKGLADKRPVFVDFTAAWCLTCQFNKRTTLADPAVLLDFETHKVLLLRADWTRRDRAITQELSRLRRSGVPVYALYSPGRTAPILLPEILSAGIVRRALAKLQMGA